MNIVEGLATHDTVTMSTDGATVEFTAIVRLGLVNFYKRQLFECTDGPQWSTPVRVKDIPEHVFLSQTWVAWPKDKPFP